MHELNEIYNHLRKKNIILPTLSELENPYSISKYLIEK